MAGEDIESSGRQVKNDSRNSNNYSLSSSFRIDESDTQWTLWLMLMFVVTSIAVLVMTILDELGAFDWDGVVQRHQGQRLVTCTRLHGRVIHAAANMLSLILIGVCLEQQSGFGFGGSVLCRLFVPNIATVGASGALFGHVGAMLLELFINWTLYKKKAAALVTLAFVIAVNLAIGILPRVNSSAHIGGLLMGFLLGFILLPRPQLECFQPMLPSNPSTKAYQYVLWLASLLLLLAGFTAALVMLFRGKNGSDHCHWCHNLICTPTKSCTCRILFLVQSGVYLAVLCRRRLLSRA